MNKSVSNPHIVPGLYIVSTPIGNLDDISLRAIKILNSVDFIACEDKRVTSKLLRHLNIKTKLLIYNDQSNQIDREKICELIKSGSMIALVSDAGTPLISDPGHKLIQYCIENNCNIYPIPGACAFVTALSASGIAANDFYFGGFLPKRKIAKENYLLSVLSREETLIFYESPKRITSTLEILAKHCPERIINVSRELTKLFEEKITGTALKIHDEFQKREVIKGEFVLIIGEGENQQVENIDDEILRLLPDFPVKDVANILSSKFGISARDIYQKCLELKKSVK